MSNAHGIHLILYEPEIPQNTGSLIRLSANTGANLHLIEPLGFDMDTKKLRRAGLDYQELANLSIHASLLELHQKVAVNRLFAISTKGTTIYNQPNYEMGDAFLFGPETRGLPADILNEFSTQTLLTIPMQAGSRSLNLSNAVSIICYEAWRQLSFQPLV